MPRTGPFGCRFVEIYPSGSCGWADRQAPHLLPPVGLPELLAALLGRFQAAASVSCRVSQAPQPAASAGPGRFRFQLACAAVPRVSCRLGAPTCSSSLLQGAFTASFQKPSWD